MGMIRSCSGPFHEQSDIVTGVLGAFHGGLTFKVGAC